MSAREEHKYTLEEYFDLERSSEARYEYWGGEVFCMSGVSANHAQIESKLNLALRLALGERVCRVFPANLRLSVPTLPPYRYADLSALCGEPEFEKIGGVDVLRNPALIVEVLSESTEGYDRGDKFTHYKSIPTFSEYLLVAQHRPHITQYVKQDDGSWSYREVNELTASLSLPSLDCLLRMSDVYHGLAFPAEPQLNLRG